MTWLDYGLIGILGISTLFGILRGFAKEAWSLTTWLAAIILGLVYAPLIAPYMVEVVEGEFPQHATAFLAIAISVFLASSLIRLTLAQFFHGVDLGSLNRFLGLTFGFGRGTIVIAILVILLGMSSISNTSAWTNSSVIPHVKPVSDWLLQKLPQPDTSEEVELPKLD